MKGLKNIKSLKDNINTCIEDEDVIHNALFTIALTTSEDYQVLPELGR